LTPHEFIELAGLLAVDPDELLFTSRVLRDSRWRSSRFGAAVIEPLDVKPPRRLNRFMAEQHLARNQVLAVLVGEGRAGGPQSVRPHARARDPDRCEAVADRDEHGRGINRLQRLTAPTEMSDPETVPRSRH
jgi:hypothetical protein